MRKAWHTVDNLSQESIVKKPHKASVVWGTTGVTVYENEFPTIKAAVLFATTISKAFGLSEDYSELKARCCTAVGHHNSTNHVKVYKIKG